MSTLDQLRQCTTIVGDTGDFNLLKNFTPQDGTTNPSHILSAAKQPQYAEIIAQAIQHATTKGQGFELQLRHAFLRVLVGFGAEILKHVPGRVSSEVDPIYSFDAESTIESGREIIGLYKELGVSPDRVLIKVASTWEGFQACKVLEKEGIHCNMTILFSMVQAKLAAEVGATLISPFVGRSMDWYHKNHPGGDYSGAKDPGVKLVREISRFYKSHNIKTEIMAASLRSIDECLHLAGVDLMTINVKLLQELKDTNYPVRRYLPSENSPNGRGVSVEYASDKTKFDFDFFNDHMAFDKVVESLRIFLKDGEELKALLRTALNAKAS
ncbi:transaldolase [Penicillium riverlandense]|uniref:transaldolase n=1 Tax=Penicillium riverlandense TaxID=1903569 RepID=UPI002546ADB9|nr:transaldolase [Penicillium riverlandense]KAJ5815099.1 transaldolase [Penicillium riverlandense]